MELRANSFYQKRSKELFDGSSIDDGFHEEIQQLRYTPITTHGTELLRQPLEKTGVILRSTELKRPVKLFIVCTMYAEPPKGGPHENDEKLAGGLIGTLKGIMNNVGEYQKREGSDRWTDILVCLVSDGRTRINEDTLEFLEAMGMYSSTLMLQEDSDDYKAMKKRGTVKEPRTAESIEWDRYNQTYDYYTYDNEAVQMHLFESVLQNKKKGIYASDEEWGPPLQMQFALKENNAGKLDSHLWFLNGFAEQLHANELLQYTVLIDVGTIPQPRAIIKLMDTMDADNRVGGCCGEIAVDNVSLATMCNPVIASQHFEYKTSNLLDKALESCFGYISVLPGAFCAYRYSAVRGKPLLEYFKSATHELGPFEGNMYLAEDRILCFQLIAKEHEAWLLRYVKNAVAVTDVPDDLSSLIRQRRRWLNGSFFAMVYALVNFKQFFNSSAHVAWRKAVISFQFVYYASSTLMAWFMLANFYLAFLVLVQGMLVDDINDDDTAVGVLRERKTTFPYIVRLLTSLYSFLLGIIVVLSLGNKPQNVKSIYNVAALLFAGLAGITYVLATQYALSADVSTLCAAASTFLVYFVAGLGHGELGHLVISFLQYMLLLPTYINVLMIYAFCNTHDLSWGTKGIDNAHGVQAAAAKKDKETRKVSQATLNYRLQQAKLELKEKQESFAKDQQRRDELQEFRSIMLVVWLATNAAAVTAVSSVFDYDASGNSQGHIIEDPKDYMIGLFYATSFFNVVRFAGSVTFLFLRLIPSFGGRTKRAQAKRSNMRVAREQVKAAGSSHKNLLSSAGLFREDVANPLSPSGDGSRMSQGVDMAAGLDAASSRKQGDWEEVMSDEGQPYYYNAKSNETSWDPPADWV